MHIKKAFLKKISVWLYHKKIYLANCCLLVAVVVYLVSYHYAHQLPSLQQPIKIYSSHTHHDLRKILNQAIAIAEKKIFLSIYTLMDPILIRSLLVRSQQGIDVHIYCDKKNKNLPLPYSIKTTTGLMHKKILTIDETIVFVGSANFTSSLYLHDNLLLGCYSPALAKALYCCYNFNCWIGKELIEVIHLPDEALALQKMISLLRQAQTCVKIAMFSLTHPILIQELIDLHHRGIHIEIVLDRSQALGSGQHTLDQLQQAQLPVYLAKSNCFHYKYAWIDHTTLICGSANWSKAGLSKNEEVCFFIHYLTDEHQKILHKLWRHVRCSREALPSYGSSKKSKDTWVSLPFIRPKALP